MQRMWNLKCTIVPVIIGATGIVTRSLKKNLETVPGKHSIDSLQKTAVLGTSHIIRKVLQCEAWSVSGGDHCWFKRNTGKKRPVTRDDNTNTTVATTTTTAAANNNNNNNCQKLFILKCFKRNVKKQGNTVNSCTLSHKWRNNVLQSSCN